MPTDLQTLELVLRRIHADRAAEHAAGRRILDVDAQELLLEIAGGLARCDRMLDAIISDRSSKPPPPPIGAPTGYRP